MLSVAARAGPFAPFVSAAAHAVPGPLRPLAPAVAHRDRKVPLEPKRPLLCRESLSGRAARGGLVVSASLNGAGRGSGGLGRRSGGAVTAAGSAKALPCLASSPGHRPARRGEPAPARRAGERGRQGEQGSGLGPFGAFKCLIVLSRNGSRAFTTTELVQGHLNGGLLSMALAAGLEGPQCPISAQSTGLARPLWVSPWGRLLRRF